MPHLTVPKFNKCLKHLLEEIWYWPYLSNLETTWFEKQTFRTHYRIGKYCITCRKLITNIELQYYVNLTANFDLNKLKNLSIWFDRQSIISIQLLFNVMEWKRPSNHFQNSKVFFSKIFYLFQNLIFLLNHKADFCLKNLNLLVTKWFATNPVNIISRKKYTRYYTNV